MDAMIEGFIKEYKAFAPLLHVKYNHQPSLLSSKARQISSK